MAWERVTDAERDRLLALYKALPPEQRESRLLVEANRLGMKYLTLIRRLQERAKQPPASANIATETPFWDADTITIMESSAIVISDIEIPDEHEGLLTDFLPAVARRFQVKTLIYAGDILAADQLSSHPQLYARRRTTLEDDVNKFWDYVQFYKSIFDRQIVIMGNHDLRINRATNGELWLGMSQRADESVIFSKKSFLNVATPRGFLRITHPYKHYSKNGIAVGQGILNKMPLKCDLMLAHMHLCQRGWSLDGACEILVLPCVRDYNRTSYVHLDDNQYPVWVTGFTLILDGYYHMLPLYGTNWSLWR